MNKTPVIVWGAGGHAIVCSEIIQATGHYEVIGFVVDPEYKDKVHCALHDATIMPPDCLADLRRRGISSAFIAVGDCRQRLRLGEVAVSLGFNLITSIHPASIVSPSARLGAGTVVMAGAVVGANADVRNNVIVNTCSSVDHDCQIADGAHISPGVRLAGNVKIGRGAWIGIGAAVKNGISIGSASLVGAGSVVLKNLPDDVMAYGVPAKIVKSTEIEM